MALIAGQKASLLRTLAVQSMPFKTGLQGAVWSAGNWWLISEQDNLAGAGGRESNHISRFDANGRYLGRMTLIGSGHGSVFAMDGTTVLVGWDTLGGDRYVRKVAWTKDRRVTESEATLVPTGTGTWNVAPLPLDPPYLTLRRTVDPYEIFYQRLYANPTVTTRTMQVRRYKSPNNNQGYAMQGAFSFGRNLFVQWGWTRDRPQRLDQYQWGPLNSTVTFEKPLSSMDITSLGWQKGDTSTEPEGICAYNGRLVVGKRQNGGGNRTFRLFMFAGVSREDIAPPVPPVTPWPPVVVPPVTPPNNCPPKVVLDQWLDEDLQPV